MKQAYFYYDENGNRVYVEFTDEERSDFIKEHPGVPLYKYD